MNLFEGTTERRRERGKSFHNHNLPLMTVMVQHNFYGSMNIECLQIYSKKKKLETIAAKKFKSDMKENLNSI